MGTTQLTHRKGGKRRLRLKDLNWPGLLLVLLVLGLIAWGIFSLGSWVTHEISGGPPAVSSSAPSTPAPPAGRPTTSPAQAFPVLGLRCNNAVQGSDCAGKVYGVNGAVALNITGISANRIYQLCNAGYQLVWSDNHGRVMSRNAGFSCTAYAGVHQLTIDQTTTNGFGVPYVYITAPEPPWPLNPPICGPWRISLQLVSPNGSVLQTVSYNTYVVAS
jgi:hypothetical protein